MLIASAQPAPNSDDNITLILVSLCALIIAAVFCAIPILVERRRRGSRSREFIKLFSIVWCLVAAGSVIYAVYAHQAWSNEYAAQLRTGYLDPSNPASTADAPRSPILLWLSLGVAYLGVLAYVIGSGAHPGNDRPPSDGV